MACESVYFLLVVKMQKSKLRKILLRGWIFSGNERSWLSWERNYLRRLMRRGLSSTAAYKLCQLRCKVAFVLCSSGEY